MTLRDFFIPTPWEPMSYFVIQWMVWLGIVLYTVIGMMAISEWWSKPPKPWHLYRPSLRRYVRVWRWK
jgi:hypothetical protein